MRARSSRVTLADMARMPRLPLDAGAGAGVLLAALHLAACPMLPASDLTVSEGALPITLGAQVTFAFSCQDWLWGDWRWVTAPGRCGGSWFVQGELGGSSIYGQITPCGVYHAPAERPPEPPEIEVYDVAWGWTCVDCCGALITLSLDGYD